MSVVCVFDHHPRVDHVFVPMSRNAFSRLNLCIEFIDYKNLDLYTHAHNLDPFELPFKHKQLANKYLFDDTKDDFLRFKHFSSLSKMHEQFGTHCYHN